jgi:hypothetical protein
MNYIPQSWAGRVLWLMWAVSACWVVYVFGLNYAGCRGAGYGELVCFFVALVVGSVELVFFVFTTILRLIALVIP